LEEENKEELEKRKLFFFIFNFSIKKNFYNKNSKMEVGIGSRRMFADFSASSAVFSFFTASASMDDGLTGERAGMLLLLLMIAHHKTQSHNFFLIPVSLLQKPALKSYAISLIISPIPSEHYAT
jgi:hypothetical protein